MKKAFILVAAIAMLATPVFAEITVTGDFSAEMSYEFSDSTYDEAYINQGDVFVGSDEGDNDIDFNFDANVGEFTTLSVGVDAEAGGNVELGELSVTQDLTGALGIDGPISFSFTIGDSDFEAKQFCDENDPITLVGNTPLDLNLTIGIMDMINVGLGFVPSSYFGDNIKRLNYKEESAPGAGDEVPFRNGAEFGITVDGVFGPASVAISYMYTDKPGAHGLDWFDGKDDDDDFTEYLLESGGLELNAVLDFTPLTIKTQIQLYNFNDDYLDQGMFVQTYSYVSYDLDMGLTFGANFKSLNAPDTTLNDSYKDGEYGFGVEVAYAVSENANVDASIDFTDVSEFADSIEVGIGGDVTLDGLTYGLDYELETDAIVDTTHKVIFSLECSF